MLNADLFTLNTFSNFKKSLGSKVEVLSFNNK